MLDKYEKMALIMLSVLLAAGAMTLYNTRFAVCREITVVRGGLEERLTLLQVEEILKEGRRVDINTATAEQISVIPGIGETLAARIVEYRQNTGHFRGKEDLLKVKGIGEKKLEKIKEYVA
ncbi:MAG: helix-hairpin-helix domain-containing protein [Candidatus Omnitrophota bacterium]